MTTGEGMNGTFYLFAGNMGHPGGGMNDFRGQFPTLDAAQGHFAILRSQDPLGASFGQIAAIRNNVLKVVARYGAVWVLTEDRGV